MEIAAGVVLALLATFGGVIMFKSGVQERDARKDERKVQERRTFHSTLNDDDL